MNTLIKSKMPVVNVAFETEKFRELNSQRVKQGLTWKEAIEQGASLDD